MQVPSNIFNPTPKRSSKVQVAPERSSKFRAPATKPALPQAPEIETKVHAVGLSSPLPVPQLSGDRKHSHQTSASFFVSTTAPRAPSEHRGFQDGSTQRFQGGRQHNSTHGSKQGFQHKQHQGLQGGIPDFSQPRRSKANIAQLNSADFLAGQKIGITSADFVARGWGEGTTPPHRRGIISAPGCQKQLKPCSWN